MTTTTLTRTPFITPTVPPPGGSWSHHLKALSEQVGNVAAVTCRDGRFSGRVVAVYDDLVVLRQGAGCWHLEPCDIVRVSVPTPETPTEAPSNGVAWRRRRERETLHRIMNRWP